MLPRSMQSVGRNWVTNLELPQLFLWNWNFLNFPWWAVNPLCARFPFPYVNTWPFQVDWKPNVLGPVRSRFPFQNARPFNVTQSSWFHLSHVNMDPQGEEPKSKRRKFTEEDRSKSNNSRNSSRASTPNREELRVPSPLESSNSRESTTGENGEENSVPEGNRFRCRELQQGNRPRVRTRSQADQATRTESTEQKESNRNPKKAKVKPAAIIPRHWEDFCHHYKDDSNNIGNEFSLQERSTTKEKFDFSVMSYNILSQDLLEDNSHLYRHCRQPILFWSYRLPNILRELRELNADVLCLQEVQEDHYTAQIKPSLESLGYLCEYKMRTGTKPDGCAICFKACKFSLVSANPVEFYRCDIPLLDRDNVGLVLLLQPKTQPQSPTICVANTHLLYNPRRGDIKLTQLAILLAEIASLALQDNGTFCPIILCGDFNAVPGSPLHSFIKEGWLNYEGLTIGKVSGQESPSRGQRPLSIPIWPESLGISDSCLYKQPQNQKPETLEDPTVCRGEQSEQNLLLDLRLTDKAVEEEILQEPEKETPENSEERSEDLIEERSEDIIEERSEDITEERSEDITEERSEDITKEITEERSEEITEERSEEITVEISEENSQFMEPSQMLNSELQHGFSLSSVYSHFVPETGIPEVTTCHSRTAVTVDYIFYSPAQNDVSLHPETIVEGKGLKLLGRLSLLTEDDLWTVNGLPNETISSDHLSLVARFRLEL